MNETPRYREGRRGVSLGSIIWVWKAKNTAKSVDPKQNIYKLASCKQIKLADV